MNSITPSKTPLMIAALRREKTVRAPIWLMRQAGRYLPEYRDLREKAGGFLNMVYDPQLASEITLQPIRRFGMDGAILFSDILVIPHALGQELTFMTGEGPKLGALDLKKLNTDSIDETLSPVYETLRQTREKLDGEGFDNTALIGFAGGLFTVACYMIEGDGSKNFSKVKNYAADRPQEFSALIDVLFEATLHYLSRQIDAGAQIIQIFESWACLLEGAAFQRWIIEPTARLVAALKTRYPHVPVIGFPRAVSSQLLHEYQAQIPLDGLGCDQGQPSAVMKSLQNRVCVQGNLDPDLLLQGGQTMDDAALALLAALSPGPYIFNLGHGVIKETDPDQVARLVKLVQEYRS